VLIGEAIRALEGGDAALLGDIFERAQALFDAKVCLLTDAEKIDLRC
jgi:hypothetical protein